MIPVIKLTFVSSGSPSAVFPFSLFFFFSPSSSSPTSCFMIPVCCPVSQSCARYFIVRHKPGLFGLQLLLLYVTC